jgi:hypothetical protein
MMPHLFSDKNPPAIRWPHWATAAASGGPAGVQSREEAQPKDPASAAASGDGARGGAETPA